MGDWNRPRHLVLADVSFMHIHCVSHSVHTESFAA